MPAILKSSRSMAGDDLDNDASSAATDLPALLAAGGDKRITIDPATGRNRYGTRTNPATSERSFASTTASNVSADGFHAAETALAQLVSKDSIPAWFDDIRSRIVHALGCEGAEIVLAASGTDVEMIAIGMMASLSARPITNILIAPDETGSGVPMAAAGRHYADLTAGGRSVVPGSMIEGIAPDRIELRTIAIRDAMCNARSTDEIDAELFATVAEALKRDRDVLIHVLDTSKTGLTGVTRQAARDAAALAPGRVRVIVDACQFRCTGNALRRDIADGFIVAMTGSKFVAGPPFSGAILMPPAIAAELAENTGLPSGLADYTAAEDWSPALRNRLGLTFSSQYNLGLGLRWVAALENLTRCAAVDGEMQAMIKRRFVQLVRERVEDIRSLSIHADDDGEHLDSRAIVALTVTNEAGEFVSLEEARKLQLAMRDSGEGPICHIGQPVHLGHRSVLRISASAIDIITVAEGMANGLTLEQAFTPVAFDLDIVFRKWAAVLHGWKDK